MKKKADFQRLARPSVRSLVAYEAKEIPCRVKLDANENPFPPALPKSWASPKKALESLNRYPDPEGKALRRILAAELDAAPSNLLLGNGSDEIISCLIAAFGGPVLFPVPTFSMYGIIARSLGERPVAVPLDESFDLDTDAMLKAVRKERPKLVFLSSPNNPTGNCFSADRILRIVEAAPGVVIVDEAYGAYASERGFLPLLADYDRLAILRTLSKIGFAALRVGYLIGAQELVSEVNKVRLPYNVNALSQAIATEGLKNRKALRARISAVVKERDRLVERLAAIPGVQPFPSEANFILLRVPDADRAHRGLIERGVLVKNMGGVIRNTLRVTIGTERENTIFLKALAAVIGD